MKKFAAFSTMLAVLCFASVGCQEPVGGDGGGDTPTISPEPSEGAPETTPEGNAGEQPAGGGDQTQE